MLLALNFSIHEKKSQAKYLVFDQKLIADAPEILVGAMSNH